MDLEAIPEDQLTKSQRKKLEKMRKKADKRDDAIKAKQAAKGSDGDDKATWSSGKSPEEGAQFIMDAIGTNAALVEKQLRQLAVPLCDVMMPSAMGEIIRDVVAMEGDIVVDIVLTRETCFAGD